MKPELTIERLIQGGFQQVGCWELNDKRDLTHAINLPETSGVYAFAINDVVQYVGLASKSLRQRLGFYRKPGVSQRTNVRLKDLIHGQLEQSTIVQILTAQPPDQEWNGFCVKGAEGLEAGLIATFDLPWNLRGAVNASMIEPENPEIASGTGFYVYDNRVINKAIVHRGHCSFCNSGSGLHGSRTTKSSTWHGPYESAAAALGKAKTCKRTRTEGCSVCSPL